MDEAAKKTQKRQFVRLDMVLPVKYRPFTGNPVFRENFKLGHTGDLSVGGIKMTVEEALPAGTKLDMELELAENLRPYLVGKVLGGEMKMMEGVLKRSEKVVFEGPDSETEDMMMKFIFEHQRREVRKGKKTSGGK